MSITRTPIIDDNGSGTTGTIIDNAWKQELYNQIDGVVSGDSVEVFGIATAATIPLSATKTTHIFHLIPGSGVVNTLTWTGGMGFNGERVLLFGRGAGVTTIANIATIANCAASAPTAIASGGAAIYTLYSGVWVLTAHEQGAWIYPPFSAANYQGAGGMTVTVASAAETARRYRLSGRSLTVALEVGLFTLAGTASATIFVTMPGGYVAAGKATQTTLGFDGNGAPLVGGFLNLTAGDPKLAFFKDRSTSANWTLGTTTLLSGTYTFEVQ